MEEHGEWANVAESLSNVVDVSSTTPDDGVSSVPRHPEMSRSAR